MISLILAHDINYAIGKGNGLPWPLLREDLRNFQFLTNQGINLITRRTLECIPENKQGQKLPGRKLLVLTGDKSYKSNYDNVTVFNNLDKAINYGITKYPDIPLNVLGGSSLYEQVFPIANIIYATSIIAGFSNSDVYLPSNVRNYLRDNEPDLKEEVLFKDVNITGYFNEYYLGDT